MYEYSRLRPLTVQCCEIDLVFQGLHVNDGEVPLQRGQERAQGEEFTADRRQNNLRTITVEDHLAGVINVKNRTVQVQRSLLIGVDDISRVHLPAAFHFRCKGLDQPIGELWIGRRKRQNRTNVVGLNGSVDQIECNVLPSHQLGQPKARWADLGYRTHATTKSMDVACLFPRYRHYGVVRYRLVGHEYMNVLADGDLKQKLHDREVYATGERAAINDDVRELVERHSRVIFNGLATTDHGMVWRKNIHGDDLCCRNNFEELGKISFRMVAQFARSARAFLPQK